MKNYVQTKKLHEILCDICKENISITGDDGYMEGIKVFYEFGFYDKIGDGYLLNIDICSNCLTLKFEEFIMKN